MTLQSHFRFFRAIPLIFLGMICLASRMAAADTNSTAATDAEGKATEAAVINSQESLRSYLLIQEQLRNTQIAIEKNRQEAEAAALHNAEQLQTRLDGIQKSLAAQRLDELKNIQKSNRTVLMAAGAFLIIGFVVLIAAAFLQWTVVNRLAAITTALPDSSLLGQGRAAAALGMGDGEMVPGQALEQSSSRFLSLVERLEQRIQDMETSVQPHGHLTNGAGSNGGNGSNGALVFANGESHGSTNGAAHEPAAGSDEATGLPAVVDKAGTVTSLLGKGQTLLKLDKPEAALACFDEALSIDPDNTDA
ncbi:MAG TPA: tetratricopeptide repeat protein, partial [Verrucomicrobiae bacterium]|nr:tetratricopeptide repeat protein [Verrucomicrobiae bacterium]